MKLWTGWRCAVALYMLFATLTAFSQNRVRFAVIGDYGGDSTHEKRVAAMIRAWEPDFILTVGDNAYSDHSSRRDAFQADVVAYYGDFIVKAADDPEGTRTRFFPTLGNHDYKKGGSGVFPERLAAYGRTFAVPAGPGGFHFYEFARGPVRFFALDSNKNAGWDGWKTDSPQALWWRAAIARTTERWKIVFFHHTPYVSGTEHENETHMRAWDFEKAGVTAVLAGHEHVYERVMVDQVPFITNGLGGTNIYGFNQVVLPGSEVRYPEGRQTDRADLFGALFVEASDTAITFEFWNLKGEKIDHWPADAPPLSKPPAPPPAVAQASAQITPREAITPTALPNLLPGDLIFHESRSGQAVAIKEITRSRYTHCGIIVERNGQLRVAEAINPVRVIGTPDLPLASVKDWIARGIDQHAVIKRISEGLSAEQRERLEVEMRKSEGKKYDGRFQWNDNAIYCSEFIYDSFNNGLEIAIGKVQTFGEFPLDGPAARRLIQERYTDQGIPFSLQEEIITPVSVMEDAKLETVVTIDRGKVQR